MSKDNLIEMFDAKWGIYHRRLVKLGKKMSIERLDAKWDTYRRGLMDWLQRRATEYPTKITSPFVFTKEELAERVESYGKEDAA